MFRPQLSAYLIAASLVLFLYGSNRQNVRTRRNPLLQPHAGRHHPISPAGGGRSESARPSYYDPRPRPQPSASRSATFEVIVTPSCSWNPASRSSSCSKIGLSGLKPYQKWLPAHSTRRLSCIPITARSLPRLPFVTHDMLLLEERGRRHLSHHQEGYIMGR